VSHVTLEPAARVGSVAGLQHRLRHMESAGKGAPAVPGVSRRTMNGRGQTGAPRGRAGTEGAGTC
jgi:hypothetical protein